MARRLGATEEMLAAVRADAPVAGAGLAPGWLAALAYADAMAQVGGAVTDAEFAELARHWDEGEIVEISMVIGLFSYFNRFTTALCIEVTR